MICFRINGWVNNGEGGDLRHHLAHYDAIVMVFHIGCHSSPSALCPSLQKFSPEHGHPWPLMTQQSITPLSLRNSTSFKCPWIGYHLLSFRNVREIYFQHVLHGNKNLVFSFELCLYYKLNCVYTVSDIRPENWHCQPQYTEHYIPITSTHKPVTVLVFR